MENTRAIIKKTLKTDSTPCAYLIGSNEDLLTEILVRLPATSILRFKSLSKDCQSLLSHPRFTLRNDKLSISPGLFVRNNYVRFDDQDRTPPPFRSLNFYPDVNGIRIVQSCNGLLLCRSSQGHKRDRMYYVFNPTTKQFVIIPLVYPCKPCFVGLAYHHTSCPQYKVFCITFSCPNPTRVNSDLVEIQIYSSVTGKWKNLNHYFSDSSDMPFGYGVYWNGAVYWRLYDRNYLSYFDLKVEQLKELPIPSPKASTRRCGYGNIYLYFGESRGHLHWAATDKHGSRVYLLVYEMPGDHSGWFVKYNVELHDLPGFCPQMIHNNQFEVIDIVRGEEEEDAFMVLKIKTKIIRCNLLDKSCKPLFDMTAISHTRIGGREVHRYIPSLTSF